MELGQVGQAEDAEGLSAFYVHSQQGASVGNADPLTQALLRAGDSKVCPRKATMSCCIVWPVYACTFPGNVRYDC